MKDSLTIGAGAKNLQMLEEEKLLSHISLALALCLRDLDSKSMYAAIFSVHVKNT